MQIKNKILMLLAAAALLLAAVGCSATPESSTAETTAATTSATSAATAATTTPPTSAITTAATTAATSAAASTEATTTASVVEITIVCETVEPTEEAETEAPPTVEQPAVRYEARTGLYRLDTMECLYEQESRERIYPASLTKVLTACTALKYASPDTVYTVGTELSLVQPHSSLCLIQQGHRLTLRDLLTGMLLSSGNDAAYTVAVNVAREVAGNPDLPDDEAAEYFVWLMNDYAAGLGAADSHFVNPDGWDNDDQYTTVRDLALISAQAMQYDEIRDIAASAEKYVVFKSGEIITWYNTNALLHAESEYYLPQAFGLKTGTTDNAGNCLIAAVKVDGAEYIAIAVNCATNAERYEKVHGLVEIIQ